MSTKKVQKKTLNLPCPSSIGSKTRKNWNESGNTGQSTTIFKSGSNLNETTCVGPNFNASKIRRNLNSTICAAGPSTFPTAIKPLKALTRVEEDENAKMQLTFAYNEYLQSLMKQLLIDQQIKKKTEILDGQLNHYEQLLNEKQGELNKILEDTKTFQKREEVSKNYF